MVQDIGIQEQEEANPVQKVGWSDGILSLFKGALPASCGML